jgi:4-diphosphocytidyl-2C-methyl-D-erythritol kinase
LPTAWFEASAARARRFLFNRLESAALDVAPELRDWRALLDELGGEHVRLTGSGSAFFGIFDRPDEAEELCARVAEEAGRRGLPLRGRWVVAPAGHGAKLLEN